MAKVTGIGGVFSKAENPQVLTDWYVEHLGLPVDDERYVVPRWGGDVRGSTVWASFPADTDAFDWPERNQWMVNDLDEVLACDRRRPFPCGHPPLFPRSPGWRTRVTCCGGCATWRL